MCRPEAYRLSAFRSTSLLILLGCILAPEFLCAQAGDSEGGEIAAFTGGMFGLGTHPTVGGSTGGVISRYAMAFLEGSYTPIGPYAIQSWPAKSTVDRSYLTDFNVSLNFRVPVHKRLAPYGILGIGMLWNALRESTIDSEGISVTHHFNQFNAAVHTGGGLRYYIGENWGIRPEINVIVSKQTYTRASIGVFLVVPSTWP